MSTEKLKHTPGPWVAEISEQTDSMDIYGNNGQCLATVRHSDQNRQANASLIAAAPQMLDALEIAELVLHPGVIGLIGNHHGAGSMNNASNAVYAIRAAIAKAKGEA